LQTVAILIVVFLVEKCCQLCHQPARAVVVTLGQHH